jgi:hypothetical protein
MTIHMLESAHKLFDLII